jgi:hypothetical protein
MVRLTAKGIPVHLPLTLFPFAANIYGKEEHQIVMVSLVTSTFITTLWIIMT